MEPGAQLLEIARRNLPLVNFVNARFEDYETEYRFDVIVAATCWHWVNPEVGYPKAHRLIVPGGHLAILRTCHVEHDPASFFFRAQDILREFPGNSFDPSSTDQLEATAKGLDNEYFQVVLQVQHP